MPFSEQDIQDLKDAKTLLENPGIAAKLTDLIGGTLEKGFELLPNGFQDKALALTGSALSKAVDVAILTMDTSTQAEASNGLHSLAASATGAVGGFFGFAALSVELPITTTIMLRSIADIARSEGEDLQAGAAKGECIKVMALGGTTTKDDGTDVGYFAVRSALANSMGKAAEHIATKGLGSEGAPALVKLITKVAERFSVQVTEKAAAQAIPAIGAVGGATINAVFTDHFQDMARGHFIVRRLERAYGEDTVQDAYAAL